MAPQSTNDLNTTVATVAIIHARAGTKITKNIIEQNWTKLGNKDIWIHIHEKHEKTFRSPPPYMKMHALISMANATESKIMSWSHLMRVSHDSQTKLTRRTE